jgi:site-specific recombinase XerD
MGRKGNKALVDEFLAYGRTHRGMSAATAYSYHKSFIRLRAHLGRTHFSEATVQQLRAFVAAPTAKSRGSRPVGSEPSAGTKHRRVAELRSLFKWLHAEGYVSSNPTLRLETPRVDNENPNPFPTPLWRELWASDLSDSDRVGFGLGMFAGLRRHEATLLAAGHFTLRKGALWLVGFKRKGGLKRNLPLGSCVRLWADRRPDLLGGDPATFLEPLARLMKDRADALALLDWQERAPRPWWCKYERPDGLISPAMFNARLKRALEAAGLAAEGRTPHMLRHAFCTNALDAGVPLLKVSRLAGHSSG